MNSNYVAEIQSTSIPNEQHVSGDIRPSTYTSCSSVIHVYGRHVSWCKRGIRLMAAGVCYRWRVWWRWAVSSTALHWHRSRSALSLRSDDTAPARQTGLWAWSRDLRWHQTSRLRHPVLRHSRSKFLHAADNPVHPRRASPRTLWDSCGVGWEAPTAALQGPQSHSLTTIWTLWGLSSCSADRQTDGQPIIWTKVKKKSDSNFSFNQFKNKFTISLL